MAYTVGDIQTQVGMLTGHENLGNRVTSWTNRVCQDIATRVYWKRQMATTIGGLTTADFPRTSTSWYSAQFSWETTQTELVAPVNLVDISINATSYATTTPAKVLDKYYNPVPRLDAMDIVVGFQGSTLGDFSASHDAQQYAWVRAFPYAGTVTTYETQTHWFLVNKPQSTGYPTCAYMIDYATAPVAMTAAANSNWMITRYFQVVLSGVMRYARLYLGDAQGYLIEKSAFENGVRDMIYQEEAVSADTPRMRGVVNEDIMRNP